MNLKSIEYFLITVEEMNITKAAERLYITQQALSSHIQRLEDEYGVTLFERRPTFRLTRAGQEMVQYSRRILEAEARMKASFSDINRNCKATMTVGMSRLRSYTFFPAMWKYFHANHPNISVVLVDGSTSTLNDMLLSNKLDIYIGIDVPNTPVQHHIDVATENMNCCFSRELLKRTYPDTWEDILLNARRNGLNLNDVIRMPFGTLRNKNRLREGLNLYFKKHDIPDIVFECNQQDVIYEMSKSGSLAGILSPVLFYRYQHERADFGDSFHVFPLTNDIAENTLSVVYRSDYPLPTYAMDFVSVACMVLRRYAKAIS